MIERGALISGTICLQEALCPRALRWDSAIERKTSLHKTSFHSLETCMELVVTDMLRMVVLDSCLDELEDVRG